MRKQIRVVKRGDMRNIEVSTHTISYFIEKRTAIQFAKQIAKGKYELKISSDGNVKYGNTYGGDPFPPRRYGYPHIHVHSKEESIANARVIANRMRYLYANK